MACVGTGGSSEVKVLAAWREGARHRGCQWSLQCNRRLDSLAVMRAVWGELSMCCVAALVLVCCVWDACKDVLKASTTLVATSPGQHVAAAMAYRRGARPATSRAKIRWQHG